MHRSFHLHKRPASKKNRYIYYVQFYDDDGKRMTARSTGQTSRAAAENWAYEQILQGLVTRKKDMKFSVFAENWFVWDQCAYLERKLNRGPYSRGYADKQRSYLLNHILPYFRDEKLSNITVEKIDDWLISLKNTSSAITANRSLSVFKVMMKEAHRLGYIPRDPAKLVTKLSEKSAEKGIFSLKEARAILNPANFERVWQSNLLHYCFNLVAATTGMRMGEIQALKRQYLHEDFVEIKHSWDRKYGLKVPKTNSFRAVSIPSFVYKFLERLVASAEITDLNALIFAGKDPYKAIDHKAVLKYFYRALKAVDITPEYAQGKESDVSLMEAFL